MLSEETLTQVIGSIDSLIAWLALERRYASLSRFNTLHLYTQKLKSLCNKFDVASVLIGDDDMLLFALNGLPILFNVFRSYIVTRSNPLSFEELHVLLKSKEQILESKVTNPDLPNPTVFTHTYFYPCGGQNSFGSRGRLGQRGGDCFDPTKGGPSALGSGYGSGSRTYGGFGGQKGSSGGSYRTCTVWYSNSNAFQLLQWLVKIKIVVPVISIFLGRRWITASKSVFGSILLSNQPTKEVSHAPMRLHLLHQHRRRVQEGLEAAIEEICKLALDDILRQYFRPAGLALIRNSIEFAPHRKDVGESSRHGGSGEGLSSDAARRVLVKGEVGEVRPDDRTIFLTFSKGYPVPHEELVDFFTKVSGDIFEAIKMEKVPEDVQPFFAKMMMQKASMIPALLNGEDRARFNKLF